jgi:type II secretory pathway pseudopilin PulG
MIVLVIIGILASFAIPRFSKSVYKTKASEFPTILIAIYNAELSLQDETGSFGPLEDLDLDAKSIESSDLFDYSVTSGSWESEFTASAKVKAPGFGEAKAGAQATINHNKEKSGDRELIQYVKTWK